MAYEGDLMEQCPPEPFDFSRAHSVVVSGSTPCGHMLLNTGGLHGKYMHIARIFGYPRLMTEHGYQRYLRENGKSELSRTYVPLRDPDASMLKLEELLSQKWAWFGLPHNCVRFVEVVLQAGGTRAGLYSNCPSRERFL